MGTTHYVDVGLARRRNRRRLELVLRRGARSKKRRKHVKIGGDLVKSERVSAR